MATYDYMDEFECSRCAARGKTWNGGDPECGFTEDGTFKVDNWNCASLNDLRQWIYTGVVSNTIHTYREDYSYVVIDIEDVEPVEGRYLHLSWYKSRGKTDNIMIVDTDNGVLRTATLDDIEAILRWIAAMRT